MAHDFSIQLRYLLDEALKVNLSAVCVCVYVYFGLLYSKNIKLSLSERNGIYPRVMANGKILEQHTNTHAIPMT